MKETFNFTKSAAGLLILFSGILILLLVFQNCSGFSSSNYGASSETVSEGQGGTIEGVIPVGGGSKTPQPVKPSNGLAITFQKDEIYQGQVLVDRSSFVDTLAKKFDYTSYKLGKAIAITLNGLGYVAMTDTNDGVDASRMALESCNLLSGRACAVILVGNKFVINSADIEKNLDYVLKDFKGKDFRSSEIPMASKKLRETALVKNYIRATGHKAMALSITGGIYATYTPDWSYTVEEAKRMALQQCELESALVPCILYAVNKEVVFEPLVWNKKARINYGNTDIKKIPPPAQKTKSLGVIKNFLNKAGSEKYAIAMSPLSYGYFGQDKSDEKKAVAEAMQKCQKGVHNSRCILYAKMDKIVFGSKDLKAKKNFGDLICKTVRYDCDEHKKMGCPMGESYWIQEPNTRRAVLKVCN